MVLNQNRIEIKVPHACLITFSSCPSVTRNSERESSCPARLAVGVVAVVVAPPNALHGSLTTTTPPLPLLGRWRHCRRLCRRSTAHNHNKIKQMNGTDTAATPTATAAATSTQRQQHHRNSNSFESRVCVHVRLCWQLRCVCNRRPDFPRELKKNISTCGVGWSVPICGCWVCGIFIG